MAWAFSAFGLSGLRSVTVVILFLLIYFTFAKDAFAVSLTLNSTQISLSQDEEFSVNVNLAINSADNAEYFLRGVFFKDETSNYCGATWNGSEWFSGPYTTNEGWKKFLKITILGNAWNGDLRAKIDSEDPDCKTSGAYKFKIQRFTLSGSASFDPQNEHSLVVTLPTLTPTPLPTSTPLPTAAKTPAPTKTSTPVKVSAVTKFPTSKIVEATENKVPSVLGESVRESTYGAESSRSGQDQEIVFYNPTEIPRKNGEKYLGENSNENNYSNIAFIGAGIGMLVACGILLFKKYKHMFIKHE